MNQELEQAYEKGYQAGIKACLEVVEGMKDRYWHLRWEGVGGEEGKKRKDFNVEVSGYINDVVSDLRTAIQALLDTKLK